MQYIGAHQICRRCLLSLRSVRTVGCQTYSGSSNTDWKSRDARKAFLDFFCHRHDHQFVPSSGVIPRKGEGTYFTNAGMNQFKPIFLGTAPAGTDLAQYRRVANSQKCVRVGGKHNDLEDVGYDLTHHTFFEMLGSWSFGAYFKREACRMALELLTEVYRLPMDRLYFTYFGGQADGDIFLKPDLECREIWLELGVPNDRVLPFGMKDNFWDMGVTGPCGPCTEIHYDHIGGRAGTKLVNHGSPDLVEIWNLVFMEFDRQRDGSLTPLPSRHVDTGMGLERLCAVLAGTHSNYNTDLFRPIFNSIQKLTGAPVYRDRVGVADVGAVDQAYRTVGDHIRMMTVCITDGLMPGRDNLDGKLRTVMHRCLHQFLGTLQGRPGQLASLVDPVVESLGDSFPEVQAKSNKVKEVIQLTEEKYLVTMEEGRDVFQKLLKQRNRSNNALSGDEIHALMEGRHGRHVTIEMIKVFAAECGQTLDMESLENALKEGKVQEILPTAENELSELTKVLHRTGIPPTDDSQKYVYSRTSQGYDFPDSTGQILTLVSGGDLVDRLDQETGQSAAVILDKTQFYAEAGGQLGDRGLIQTKTGRLAVTDTQSHLGYVVHTGYVTEGFLAAGQEAVSTVDQRVRLGCMRGHTATHLVNAALRHPLPDVQQRGSSIKPGKLWFDFACLKSVATPVIAEVEERVKTTIQKQVPVTRCLVPASEAFKMDGVVFLENETYPGEVFVVSLDVGDCETDKVCHSVELCGGTHVLNTGDIGDFCILSLTGVAQGTKRITCLTGEAATKVIAMGDSVARQLTELETLVAKEKDIDRWSDMRHSINQAWTDEVMPKLVRDEVKRKITNLDAKIDKKLRKRQMTRLTEEMRKLAAESPFLVKHVPLKSVREGKKLMNNLDVAQPVILVVETGKQTAALVSLQQGCGQTLQDVCQRLGVAVDGRVVDETGSIGLVLKDGVTEAQIFCSKAQQILAEV